MPAIQPAVGPEALTKFSLPLSGPSLVAPLGRDPSMDAASVPSVGSRPKAVLEHIGMLASKQPFVASGKLQRSIFSRLEVAMIGSVFALMQGVLAPLLATSISVAYFRASPRTEPLSKRIAASAHGVTIALIYVTAILVWWAGISTPRLATPYLLLLLLPLSLIVTSFFLFRGRRIFHWLQVLNFMCLIWTGFVGGMAVTGDWL